MKKIFLTLLIMSYVLGVFAQLTASINSQDATCYGLCNGTITVTPSGGTPGYTYAWSSGQTTQTISSLCVNTYSVTVTDNLGATTIASASITSPPQMVLTANTINLTCFGACNGVATLNIVGGTPPYTYLWSNGVFGPQVVNLCVGAYTVTVMDANACTATTSFVITQPPLFTANITTMPDTCHQNHGSATVIVSGGVAPYFYTWNNLAATPTITNLPSGNYSVTVTETNGCVIAVSGFVNDLIPSFDLGSNYSICLGICDTLVPIPSGGSSLQTYLWNDFSTNDSLLICPSSSGVYTLTATDAFGCSYSDSIYVTLVEHCNKITGIFYNDLNNDGVKDPGENPVANRIVMVNPGSLYATTNTNGYYEFLVDTGNFIITPINNSNYTSILPINHQASLFNAYEIDSLNDFGAYVEPHGDLRVYVTGSTMRPGFSSSYFISYYNFGTDAADATVIFNMSSIPDFISSSLTPTTQVGDSFVWEIAAIPPNAGGNINLAVNIPNTVQLGTQVFSNATILPILGDTIPLNNYSSCMNTVTGSWDPNDKAVIPSGVFTPSMLTSGDYLNYLIRFQNTGTDTAFNIHIIDTLSANLDMTSFELVSSSHHCDFNLYGTGIVDFLFNNILLPDSNVNELGSNGYVAYKIRPKNTLNIGDEIANTAYIYFDFNLPVMTNTVSTMVDEAQTISYSDASKGELHVWPNPSSGNFMFSCNVKNNKNITVEVCDMLGKIVFNKQIEYSVMDNFSHSIHINGNGIYFVKVTTSEDVYTARVIISK